MSTFCDFVEQETVAGESGRLRPDAIVRLPSERVVVIDAKVPLAAYLDAVEAGDEYRRDQALAPKRTANSGARSAARARSFGVPSYIGSRNRR